MTYERKESLHRWFDSIILTAALGVISWIAVKQYDTNARVVRLETLIESSSESYKTFEGRLTTVEQKLVDFQIYVEKNYKRKL